LSQVTAAAAMHEETRWEVLSLIPALGNMYDLFCPHPPHPLKLTHTPDITVGWYLPLSSSSTAMASSGNSTVADVATGSPLIGDKCKHVADEDSGACMLPMKWFKGANPDPTEADLGPIETDPGTLGDEMEGVVRSHGNDVGTDVDMPMEGVECPLNNNDAMDVDLGMDDLNGHIRCRMLGVLLLEYVAVRITYLS
jgi:hypothetical protein